jgi:hypothetical protein
MKEKIPGRALVFTYRRVDKFFHEVAERTFEGKHTYCSSWPGLEPVNLQKDFYKYYRDTSYEAPLSAEDYQQIIARCPVLRLLPWDQARRMTSAMYRVIDELTDKAQPDYLLSVMVDDYMTDLLARICTKKNARVVTFLGGIVNNTITVTSRGEFNKVRDPSESETEKALNPLLDDRTRITYHLKFKHYSFWDHLAVWFRWWAKAGFFKLSGSILRDPWNFRFLQGSLTAMDGQSSLSSFRCRRFFNSNWEEALAQSAQPAIFIPLNYTPEATVSYWLNDLRYIEYEKFILDACKKLSRSYLVLVKEHWSALGARRWPFYQALTSIPGVVLVPAEVNSRYVMGRVEQVLVGASTTGIEAAVRGKKVATLDRPYYYLPDHYLNIGSADKIDDLPRLLEAFQAPPLTKENQMKVVRRVLEPTIRGHLLPDSYIDTEANFRTTSEGLKEYLSRPG